jgi:hypothetical protein
VDGEVDTDTDTDTGPGPFDYARCGRSAVVERVIHSAGAADFRRVVYAPDGSYALVLQEWDDVWRFDPEDESLTRVAELTGATLYELAFDRTGAYALIGGSTASSTAPELRLWRYTPERGVERIVPPAFQSGGPPTSARRVTAFDQRADGTWAVLSDSYGTTQTPGNLLYLNELVIDDVSDGAWTYRAGVNSGATASWAPDTVGWAKNLGQDVVLTSTAQGTTHVWDAVNGWKTYSHPGKGNLGEVMVDPVGREVAWVLNGFTAKVYTWEGTVLRDGPGESYSMAPTGIGIWRMGRSPDGAWKVFVGSAGKLWFTDSAWRPLDSARFYNATIPNFSQPPWSGSSGDGLADVAWRPGTCEGLVVGSEAQGQAILGWWSLQ